MRLWLAALLVGLAGTGLVHWVHGIWARRVTLGRAGDTRPVLLAAPGIPGAGGTESGVRRGRWRRRFDRPVATAALIDLVTALARRLRAGQPLSEAMTLLGAEPVVGRDRRQLRARVGMMAEALALGRSLEEAAGAMTRDRRDPDLSLVAAALSLHQGVGGNLAETLDRLASTLRARQALRLQLRASISEARATAMLLGALPFLTSGLMAIIAPAYVAPLWSDPTGQLIALAALACLALGLATMGLLIAWAIG